MGCVLKLVTVELSPSTLSSMHVVCNILADIDMTCLHATTNTVLLLVRQFGGLIEVEFGW